MDGQFVPNITFGPDVIAAARRHTSLPFEAHLMILHAGAAGRGVRGGRLRAADRPRRVGRPTSTARLDLVRSLGATPAWPSPRPPRPSPSRYVLDLVDMVLVMTVNPGFGGQDYLATMEPKIAEVRGMIAGVGLRRRRRGRRRHQRQDGGRRRRRPGPTCWWRAARCSTIPTASGHAVAELRDAGRGGLPLAGRLTAPHRRALPAAGAAAGRGAPADRAAGRPGRPTGTRRTGSIRDTLRGRHECAEEAGALRDNLGLSGGPALGDAPPAYHRPMAFDLVRTTYGPAALDALAAAVARAKGDEPLRPVTVVVPSNYAGVAARRALARRHGVIGVGFVTLYRLAELLAGPTLARSGRVPVSSSGRGDGVPGRPGARTRGCSGPSRDQPVDRGGAAAGPPRAAGPGRPAAPSPRPRATPGPRRWWRSTSGSPSGSQTRWHDETDLMVTAAALVRGGDAVVDVGPLVVHLPQQISSSAARLLQAVAAHAPVTVIAGLTGRADAPVERLLGRLDLAGEPPAPPTPAGLSPEPFVELTVAADEDDEVRTALRRVVEAAEAGVALERIAIVHAPRAPYGRLLSEHLTAARLPWNGITASSVTERVAGRTLLGLLDLDATALRRRDVFALLASVPPSRRRPVAALGAAGPAGPAW